LQVDLHYTSWK